ncbi:DUF2382 domain-containing protein [Spirosoma soli]|uniref:DUF2382 domain-containing protein n=1 Tax=Spirosoma soli TaxID=1770529 RepID=A0ABW5M0K7_9BACT
MALTVIGVFDNATEAQQAVDQLVSNGFSRSNIDLSAQTGNYTNDSYTSGSLSGTVPDRHQNTSGTYAEEVVDDTKDVGDKVGNFFGGLFGSNDNDDARRYTTVGQRGSIVTVHAQSDDEAERAADILDDNGAVDVNERAAQYSGTAATGVIGTSMTDATTVNTSDRFGTTDNDQTLKVVEENLQVGKREVERGGVRVRSRIIERPVEESLRLREERVHVYRTPVNRPATEADLNAFQEGEITLTEHTEVPVVSKTANVVEEISVNKDVTEREEVIRDTVRRTDVDVEQINPTDSTTRTGLTTDLDDDDVTYSTK